MRKRYSVKFATKILLFHFYFNASGSTRLGTMKVHPFFCFYFIWALEVTVVSGVVVFLNIDPISLSAGINPKVLRTSITSLFSF